MQADDIGGRKELVEWDAARSTRVDHIHTVRLREPGYLARDPAETHQAEESRSEALAEKHVRRPDPVLPAPDEPIALGDAPYEREHQRDGQLGGRRREHVRGGRDDDAASSARGYVDVVEADGEV